MNLKRVCNFFSQLCICPTCTQVIWAPARLHPETICFRHLCSSATVALLCILMDSNSELAKLHWAFARGCRQADPASDDQLRTSDIGRCEMLICLYFSRNSELRFCTCRFDVVSTKSKTKIWHWTQACRKSQVSSFCSLKAWKHILLETVFCVQSSFDPHFRC